MGLVELGPTVTLSLGHVLYVEAQVELGLTVGVVLGVLSTKSYTCCSARPLHIVHSSYNYYYHISIVLF